MSKLPIPTTKMTEAILGCLQNQCCFQLTFLVHFAIIPNNKMDTPPITGVGIEEINAVLNPVFFWQN